MPGNWDTVNCRALFSSRNPWGIPDLPPCSVIPDRLIPYTERYACDTAPPGSAVHFFLDDYRFETVWTKPERPLGRLRTVGAAITPDFSLWPAMPIAVQLWQVYRARWCGAWMAAHEITVIPAVSWAEAGSFRFAFTGIAPGTTVAVSAVGVNRSRPARALFAAGYTQMLTAIAPARVLFYGDVPGWLDPVVPVACYPARWEGRPWAAGAAQADHPPAPSHSRQPATRTAPG
jgi:Vilmaviridae nuclease